MSFCMRVSVPSGPGTATSLAPSSSSAVSAAPARRFARASKKRPARMNVVTTDATGAERYYRGGPGGPGGGPTYGSIITNDGPYVAGTVDWAPGAPSRTVMSGPTACGHDACLAAELRRIDGTGTAYAPTGPNSNTVASTILTNCHIPRGKPVWVAPGWDDPAI